MMKNLLRKSLVLFLGVVSLAGCTNVAPASSAVSSEATSSSASVSMIDYVSQAVLKDTYAGKHFLTDGIGAVTLKEKIDGDTAHFQQTDGDTGTIKGRYLCIDTPESTGMVEPWGHGASVFNGDMLANAKTIVLSSDSGAASKPATDSTGGRFLVYVWVSPVENGDPSTFTLVNLALVQNGWSKAKGATGTDYASAFLGASSQAQRLKLHVWSSEKDPDYNYNTPTETTIKQIVDGVDVNGAAFNWDGAKATFTGIVYACGPDKGAAFVNKDFTFDENGVTITRRYGLYIFTSYVEYTPLATIGNEVQITGIVSNYQGILQITGVSYSDYFQNDGDMVLLSQNNPTAPLTGTAAELAVDANVNVVVKATGLTCTGGYATQNTATKTAYSFTLYCKDSAGTSLNLYIVDGIAINNESTGTRVQSVDYFKGATSLAITGGLVTYTTSTGKKTYQIKLCKAADLVVTF